MRYGLWIAAAALLCGCGSSPSPVRSGPGLAATLVATWRAEGPGRELSFSRDGKLLATSDASGRITVRDARDWHVVERLQHPGGATSIAFSRSGSAIFSGGYDGAIRFWDLRTGKQTGALTHDGRTIWSLDLSPDGKTLASAGEDAAIAVWNLATPLTPKLLRGHQRNIWEVRFSPDGKRLASGSFDDSVRLWDRASRRSVSTLTGHTQAVVGLDYSADGKLLATGSDDSTVRLWRASDGAPLRTIDNGMPVDKVAFSPDGRWLVSGGHARGSLGTLWHQVSGGGGDGPAVRIWRTGDGALVAELPHPDDVVGLAFSPDGHWLVTAGEDSRFRLWRLQFVEPRRGSPDRAQRGRP